MPWALVLAHVLPPSAVAVAAGFGAWRCWRLLQYARDARLLRLMAFYGLFAASLLPLAVWTGQVAADAGGAWSGRPSDLHGEFAGAQRVDVLLVAHHALMLASLGVAVAAFGRGGAVAAAVALASLAPFVLLALVLEAAMTFYLAVVAVVNHRRRRSRGALQVAAGFLLVSLGHLSFVLFHQPGAARSPVGDVLALVGVVLLVRLLPRPSA